MKAIVQDVFNQFFEQIQEADSKFSSVSRAAEVDVMFQEQVVPFIIHRDTTFGELRKDTAKYWYLREQDVFFTSEPGRTAAVHLLDSLVLEELYPWLNLRENTGNRKLYLVLGNFENVASKLDPFIRTNAVDLEDVDLSGEEDADLKQSENEVKVEIKSRMRKHLIMNIVQSVFYVALLVVWILFLLLEKNVTNTSWMNFSLQKNFFYNPNIDTRLLYSVYPDVSASPSNHIGAVRDVNALWDYMAYLRDLLIVLPHTTDRDPATLNLQIRFFHIAELRQFRSSVEPCDHFGANFTCIRSASTTLLGSANPHLYGSASNTNLKPGFQSFLQSGGYTAQIDVSNLTDWDLTINYMTLTQWINVGTRAVVLTLNAYCPSIAIVTVIRCVFEVDKSMQILPSYQLTSFPYSIYNPAQIALQLLLQFLIFVLTALLVYDSQFLPTEMVYFAHRNREADLADMGKPAKLLENWHEQGQKPFLMRLRGPYGEEIVSKYQSDYLSFLFISILQIVRLVWYFQVFKPQFKIVHTEYVDLSTISDFSKVISDLDSAVLLLMMVAVIKYVMFWFDLVAVMSIMMKRSMMMLMRFLAIFYLPLIAFFLAFHYIIGPYEFYYYTNALSLLVMLKAELGTWSSERDFAPFLSPYYVAFLLMLFIFWRLAVLFLQTTNIRWELMEARKLKPTRQKKKRPVQT